MERDESNQGGNPNSKAGPSPEVIRSIIEDASSAAIAIHVLVVLLPMLAVPLRHPHERGTLSGGAYIGLLVGLAIGHFAMTTLVWLMARRVAKAVSMKTPWVAWLQLLVGISVSVTWFVRVLLTTK